jgi:hypothetical protein
VTLYLYGIAAANRPIIHPPGDKWIWSNGGMIVTGEHQRTQRKTCPTATLTTANPTWTALGVNLGLHGEKPVSSHLYYGMAQFLHIIRSRIWLGSRNPFSLFPNENKCSFNLVSCSWSVCSSELPLLLVLSYSWGFTSSELGKVLESERFTKFSAFGICSPCCFWSLWRNLILGGIANPNDLKKWTCKINSYTLKHKKWKDRHDLPLCIHFVNWEQRMHKIEIY